MTHSTRALRSKKGREKPAVHTREKLPKRSKRLKDLGLFPGRCGRWRKKVGGRVYYLGKWADDPQGKRAAQLWIDQKDEILAGNPPKPKDDALTLAELANRFLTEQEERAERGEIKHRTFRDYRDVCVRLVTLMGRYSIPSRFEPSDFADLRKKLRAGRSPATLLGDITRIRVLFTWAVDNKLLSELPTYHKNFNKPSAVEMRRVQNAHGPRMFSERELWKLLYGDFVDGKRVEGASQPMRTMILLGLNAALGNADVGLLPIVALDLQHGWLDFPRPKTEVFRRVPLWPETVEAIEEWLTIRPRGNDSETNQLLFVTRAGNGWHKENVDDRPVTKEFAKLLRRLRLHKYGRGFYDLRRTFRTIASGSLDEPACDAIMGHVKDRGDMAAKYRQVIWEARLRKVTDYVHDWLWPRPFVG